MAVKVCPSCGEGNRESAHICVVCGSSLRGVVPQGILNSEKEYKSSHSKPSHCSHCHEPLEKGALKCKYCGTLVSRRSAAYSYALYDDEMTSPVPDNAAMSLIVISTILIPLVGLIVGGVASFSDDSDKRDTGKMLLILGIGMIAVQFTIFLIIRS
ncbi:double zinc ribbon domain-containing protein [Paenibacillus dakarensis]|uniref:double zinc ribbon domain-containing protein n=1 Tax=Paenibacillus dakarensis TaxID=1527293 RepID=UPI0006D55F56|nr:zinc ribbon domain-containing protein [Paenibacillus dakarensis]